VNGRGPAASNGLVCCDLDGVVWRGDTPIEGSAGAVRDLRAAGRRVVLRRAAQLNVAFIPVAFPVRRSANPLKSIRLSESSGSAEFQTRAYM